MQADPETGAYGTRTATYKQGEGKKEWLQSTQTVDGARIEARQDGFGSSDSTGSFNDACEGCEEGRSWPWPMGRGEIPGQPAEPGLVACRESDCEHWPPRPWSLGVLQGVLA